MTNFAFFVPTDESVSGRIEETDVEPIETIGSSCPPPSLCFGNPLPDVREQTIRTTIELLNSRSGFGGRNQNESTFIKELGGDGAMHFDGEETLEICNNLEWIGGMINDLNAREQERLQGELCFQKEINETLGQLKQEQSALRTTLKDEVSGQRKVIVDLQEAIHSMRTDMDFEVRELGNLAEVHSRIIKQMRSDLDKEILDRMTSHYHNINTVNKVREYMERRIEDHDMHDEAFYRGIVEEMLQLSGIEGAVAALQGSMKDLEQEDSCINNQCLRKDNLRQIAILEEKNALFKAEVTEMVKLEQTKFHKASQDHMEQLKQMQQSLSIMNIERCAVEESIMALVEEYREEHMYERDQRCHRAVVIEERIKELSETILTEMPRKVVVDEKCFKSLKDEVKMNTKTLDALTEESVYAGDETHSLQVGLNDLCKNVDAFKETFNDVTLRLWNAIDKHTHTVCMDACVPKRNQICPRNEHLGFKSTVAPKANCAVVARYANTPQHDIVHEKMSASTQNYSELPVATMISGSQSMKPMVLVRAQ